MRRVAEGEQGLSIVDGTNEMPSEHHAQMAITRGASAIPGWRSRDLWYGWRLHHHPALPVSGEDCLLLGKATELKFEISPQECIADRPLSEDDTYTWAGRWSVLSGSGIFNDAGGLFGLFYGTLPSTGEPIITTSLAVAAILNGGGGGGGALIISRREATGSTGDPPRFRRCHRYAGSRPLSDWISARSP